MPVQLKIDVKHPSYKARESHWSKVRDVLAGASAIKAAKSKYLPEIAGGDEAINSAYRGRAQFLSVAARTLEGLAGFVVRKDPTINLPESMREELESIGAARESLSEIAKSVIKDILSVSRVGALIDSGDGDTARPYIALYRTEAIFDWEDLEIDGRMEPVFVSLREKYWRKNERREYQDKTRFRYLRLGTPEEFAEMVPQAVNAASDGLVVGPNEQRAYWQEVWVKEVKDGKETDDWMLDTIVQPLMFGGRPMHRIPFEVGTPEDLGLEPPMPSMLPLAEVNISHYHNSADLEWGRHWTALPQPVATGWDLAENETLTIGSARAWVSENEGAKAAYLEFTGAGLGHLKEGMDDKIKQMSVLGARMLEQPATQAEAAQTVRLRHSGEQSVVAASSGSAGEFLSRVLWWYVQWQTVSEVPRDKVTVEFHPTIIHQDVKPELLGQMIAMVQTDMISWNTLFAFLERVELIPDGVSEDDEIRRIKQDLLGLEDDGDEEDETGDGDGDQGEGEVTEGEGEE